MIVRVQMICKQPRRAMNESVNAVFMYSLAALGAAEVQPNQVASAAYVQPLADPFVAPPHGCR